MISKIAANIYFNNKSNQIHKYLFNDLYDSEYHFGIIDLKIPKIQIKKNPIYILFTCDLSASMQDICFDSQNKIQHIIHITKNILNLLNNFVQKEQLDITIQIQGFNNKIFTIIDKTKINTDILNSLFSKIDSLLPMNGTNIEIALSSAFDILNSYLNESSDYEDLLKHEQKYHILMTDGQANIGITDPTLLIHYIDTNYQNIFIGLGENHDDYMLNSLSSIINGSYFYIDKIENSSIIFGEIIHNIIYKVFDSITISIQNGEIYNYETNIWNTELKIYNISSDSHKIFHIRTNNYNIMKTFITSNPTILDQTSNITIQHHEFSDLTKLLFRQKTQEYIFLLSKFIPEKNYIPDTFPIITNSRIFTQLENDFDIYSLIEENEEEEQIVSDNDQEIIQQHALLDNLFNFNQTASTIYTEPILFTYINNSHPQIYKKPKILSDEHIIYDALQFLNYIKKYIQSIHHSDIQFYTRLYNDLYIISKTFKLTNARKYSASIMHAQGRGYTYNITLYENDIDSNQNHSHLYSKNNTLNYDSLNKNKYNIMREISQGTPTQLLDNIYNDNL
jgi:hypothetical protein